MLSIGPFGRHRHEFDIGWERPDLEPSYASPGPLSLNGGPRAWIYRTTGGLTQTSVCYNNGTWLVRVPDATYAVYQDDDRYVELRRRGALDARVNPRSSAASTAALLLTGTSGSTWERVHRFESSTGAADGYEYGGASIAKPCLAARVVGGATGIAVAYRSSSNDMYVGHSEDAYVTTDVSGSAITNPHDPSMVMDEDGYTYLVFTGTAGGVEGVFLSVREPGGTWSSATAVNSQESDPSSGDAFEKAGFASVAVSGSADPNGLTVLVSYTAYYTTNANNGRIRARAMTRIALDAASWDMSGALEWDVGGANERRDSCAVATSRGTFLVFYVSAVARADTAVLLRWNSDPGTSTSTWTEVRPVPDTRDARSTQAVQDFPSAVIDEAPAGSAISGLCLLAWEDADNVVGYPQIPYGAVADLNDLSTWTPLGNLTTGTPGTDQGQFPCPASAGGLPAVGWMWGDETGTPALLAWRQGSWS